jgi:GMP synthase (glutamine-hydrolysing)
MADTTGKARKPVCILDAGSQYGKLIKARLEELGVESTILPISSVPKGYRAIIISGTPDSMKKCDIDIFSLGVPVLGICRGMQLLGGKVEKKPEEGVYKLSLTDDGKKSELFKGIRNPMSVLLAHTDSVAEVPSGFTVTAKSENGLISAIEKDHIYGVQFHPEVDQTTCGSKIFSNFLFDIAKVERRASGTKTLKVLIRDIVRDTEKRVLVLVSGGVVSAVRLALFHQVIANDRIVAIHIDTGLLRATDRESVELLRASFPIKVVDKSSLFIGALNGVTDPVKKRIIIEELFTKLTDEYRQMGNLFIDPLVGLSRSHIRQIGYELGLDERILRRPPFPSSGLSTRIMCSNGEPVQGLEQRDGLIPIKSVGGQQQYGYSRLCGFACHGWNTHRALTMIWSRSSGKKEEISNGCSTVFSSTLFNISCPMYVDKGNLDLLRAIDEDISRIMSIRRDTVEITQMPVILLPVAGYGGQREVGKKSIVLRPVVIHNSIKSQSIFDAGPIISLIEKKYPEIGCIFVEETSAPPGTVEWEQ